MPPGPWGPWGPWGGGRNPPKGATIGPPIIGPGGIGGPLGGLPGYVKAGNGPLGGG